LNKIKLEGRFVTKTAEKYSHDQHQYILKVIVAAAQRSSFGKLDKPYENIRENSRTLFYKRVTERYRAVF
jgi:hypothetical protein